MTKITIFSGFLGAGKTTLIKKLIQEGYKGEKLVLIENEFGQIGIDGGFLQDAGVERLWRRSLQTMLPTVSLLSHRASASSVTLSAQFRISMLTM